MTRMKLTKSNANTVIPFPRDVLIWVRGLQEILDILLVQETDQVLSLTHTMQSLSANLETKFRWEIIRLLF